MDGCRASTVERDKSTFPALALSVRYCSSGSFAYRSVEEKEVEPYIRDEQEISSEVIELAKFEISTRWGEVATIMGFSDEDKQALKSKYIGTNEEEHLDMRYSPPGYCLLIEEMIRMAEHERGIPKEVIIQALDQGSNLHGISFERAQKSSQILLDYGVNPKNKYDSYIFLIWIKHPEKFQSSPLPNTKSCPVQKTSSGWALCNPDKLVVLWFSSSTFNAQNNDKKTIDDFRHIMTLNEVSNLLLLDVDSIDWGNEKRKKYSQDELKVPIKDFLYPKNPEVEFGEYLDGLRVILLSMGKMCILSALRGENYHIQKEDVPGRGAYFDMDYIPIHFQSYSHSYKPLCRDACFDCSYFYRGRRSIEKYIIPNSMLATCNEHQSTLEEWSMLMCFSEHGDMARKQPYLCSNTKIFRMSDVKYDENGFLVKWNRDLTWSVSFKDKDENDPLVLKREQYPEYLVKYLENPRCKNDPMAPKQP